MSHFFKQVCRIGTALHKLIYRAPSSASAADDITAFIICATTVNTAPLFVGLYDMRHLFRHEEMSSHSTSCRKLGTKTTIFVLDVDMVDLDVSLACRV